jgi:hypothetical protein
MAKLLVPTVARETSPANTNCRLGKQLDESVYKQPISLQECMTRLVLLPYLTVLVPLHGPTKPHPDTLEPPQSRDWRVEALLVAAQVLFNSHSHISMELASVPFFTESNRPRLLPPHEPSIWRLYLLLEVPIRRVCLSHPLQA